MNYSINGIDLLNEHFQGKGLFSVGEEMRCIFHDDLDVILLVSP